MMRFPIGFLTFALAAFPSAPLFRQAADGDLDPTFGVGGKVRYEGPLGSPLSASASAIQLDGKIIVAGSVAVPPDRSDFLLTRFKADGSLDITFGMGGKVTTDFSQQDSATAVAIRADGKIVVAGRAIGSSEDFLLARYNADGSLDGSFGVGGKVTADFAGLLDVPSALAIQSDGKIVAAGFVYLPTSSDFGLVRFNADGSLDTAFGVNGKVTTDFVGRHDQARALAIQSDGKIVAVGLMAVPPDGKPYFGLRVWRGGLVRYNKDGSLDTTFGTGGKVITEILGISEFNAVSIQSDGKIIAAGRSAFVNDIFLPGPTGVDFGLVRYNEDGSLDTTFGVQGRVTTDLNTPTDVIYDLSLQPDGKIIAAGDSDLLGWFTTMFGLARYNRDGSLDTTFGSGGKIRMELPPGQFAYARFAGIQPDGKIVVAGGGQTFDEDGYPVSTAFELVRFNNSGLQIVSAIHFDPVNIAPGGSWNVKLSGSNLTDQTYFDVRFRSPGSTTDQVALNWQRGTSARHTVAAGTEAGTWIVTGVRVHESVSDHGGEFAPVSARLDVSGLR